MHNSHPTTTARQAMVVLWAKASFIPQLTRARHHNRVRAGALRVIVKRPRVELLMVPEWQRRHSDVKELRELQISHALLVNPRVGCVRTVVKKGEEQVGKPCVQQLIS